MATENYPDDEVDKSLVSLATAARIDEPHYSPAMVKYGAVWPAAEELWGESWLDAARPGPALQFPRWDNIDGQTVEACLIAKCEQVPVTDDPDDESDLQSFHSVVLNYQVTVTDMARDYILAPALYDWRQDKYAASNYLGQKLAAKKCASYAFESGDDDKEVIVTKARIVTLENTGEIIWNSADILDDNLGIEPDFPQRRLYEDDLQTIGKALLVLTGSAEYLASIEEIKGHPIEDY